MINDKSNTTSDDKTTQTCSLCKKEYDSFEKLELHYASHLTTKLPVPNVKCSICGKCVPPKLLKKHMYHHTDDMPFPCTLCDKKFKTRMQLTAHTNLHNQHSTHVCDICGNTFKRQIYLNVHKQKVHPVLDSKIETLECYVCQQQYKSLLSLRTHINVHFVPKNHLCTQCGQRFRRIGSLQKHLLRADHGGEENRKFQCEFCQKKFPDRTRYITHRYVHTNERPFKCTYEGCDKAYRDTQSLKDHYRRHIGEFPHHCKLCDYKTTQSKHLKRHELVHMGIPTRMYGKKLV